MKTKISYFLLGIFASISLAVCAQQMQVSIFKPAPPKQVKVRIFRGYPSTDFSSDISRDCRDGWAVKTATMASGSDSFCTALVVFEKY